MTMTALPSVMVMVQVLVPLGDVGHHGIRVGRQGRGAVAAAIEGPQEVGELHGLIVLVVVGLAPLFLFCLGNMSKKEKQRRMVKKGLTVRRVEGLRIRPNLLVYKRPPFQVVDMRWRPI